MTHLLYFVQFAMTNFADKTIWIGDNAVPTKERAGRHFTGARFPGNAVAVVSGNIRASMAVQWRTLLE